MLKTKPYKHILVLEDNNAILDVITLILQSEAYRVEGLSRSAEMMASIEGFEPDLMIMDIMLPDGDGRELLTQLRKNKATSHIPVLMISAKYSEKNLLDESCKPDGFLAKPFDIDDLLDKIEGILQGKKYLD